MSDPEIGDEEVEIEAILNGRPLKRRVRARQHLADFLRQELELTGTHLGCEHGICGAGACTRDGSRRRPARILPHISGRRI
jgi:carbon-monoxide dehydrogenase small subunit